MESASAMDLCIVVVANRKGGTGKTTTVVNLAAQWARSGHRVLVVDLDPQGHAAVGLGLRPPRGRNGVHLTLMEQKAPIEDCIVASPQKNVWIAPADTDFDESRAGPPLFRLKDVLRSKARHLGFTRVVIDTPPTVNPLMLAGLAAADGVVVPFLPHHLAAIGVKELTKVIYRVRVRFNEDLRLFGLLPVMFDGRIRLHRKVVEEVRLIFGKGRVFQGIRSDIKVAEAFGDGKPVLSYASKTRGALDYAVFARQLESLIEGRAGRGERPGRVLQDARRRGR